MWTESTPNRDRAKEMYAGGTSCTRVRLDFHCLGELVLIDGI